MRAVGGSPRVPHSLPCLRALRVVDETREDFETRHWLLFLCEKLSLPARVAHRALLSVLARFYLNHHQHDWGCKSRDSQRRWPLADQLALYLTHVVLLPRLSEGRGYASRNL